MKVQSKAIRDIIRQYYPELVVSVKLVPTYNYALSSDRIEVRCLNATEEQLNDIYKIVCENTHNISVTLGKFTTAKGSEDPEIFNPSSGEWVDADMVEFVLIKGYGTVNS